MTFKQKKIEIVYKIIEFAKDYKENSLGNIDEDSLLPQNIKNMLVVSMIK